jgi:hypothetical protein
MAAAAGAPDVNVAVGGAPPGLAPNGRLLSVFGQEGVRRARTLFRHDRRPMTAPPKGNPLHGNQQLGEKLRFVNDRSDTTSVIVDSEAFQARWKSFTSNHLEQVIDLCAMGGPENVCLEVRSSPINQGSFVSNLQKEECLVIRVATCNPQLPSNANW